MIRKIGFGAIIVVFFIAFIGSLCTNNNSENQNVEVGNSTNRMSKEWQESSNNQAIEYGGEKSYSSEVIYNLEHRYGRTLESVFEDYLNHPIGRQEILQEEPLRSFIIKCTNDEVLRFMMQCRNSNDGLVKITSEHITYTYDCYYDSPNGNYFSIAFLSGSSKGFFLELKINGKVYNVNIDESN